MCFHPLGRAEESLLLAIPRRIDQSPPRPHAALCELTDRARLLEHGHLSADRIAGAMDPCIVMIAANDPLIREVGSREPRDHVVRGTVFQLNSRRRCTRARAGSEVVGDRERPAPFSRRNRAAQRAQERERVAV